MLWAVTRVGQIRGPGISLADVLPCLALVDDLLGDLRLDVRSHSKAELLEPAELVQRIRQLTVVR